jgi:ABC-type transport system involved in cytochrome c biogenesis ATPase subunit
VRRRPSRRLTITRFYIEGLFETLDVDIPIKDNSIVLVGVNGIGKSTVINIFYYFVSRQWRRLSEFHFSSATIEINGKVFCVHRNDLNQSLNVAPYLRYFPTRYVSAAQRFLEADELEAFVQLEDLRLSDVRRLSDLLGMPTGMIREMHSLLRAADFPLDSLQPEVIRDLTRALAAEIGPQILYLPTYRRIEKDLRFIFPELDEDVFRYQRRVGMSRKADHYVELVSFGMEDVEGSIRETLASLKEEARTALNGLAGSYLRDVIRGSADTYDRSSFREIDEETISDTLDRVEERTLPERDKEMLRGFVQQLRQRGKGRMRVQDRYLAHFFSRLMKLTAELRAREQPIRAFASVCNNYLEGKQIIYNEKDYSIGVTLSDGRSVELSDLSSGEKQIVSLFAHIYLTPDKRFLVIIDEPELSLSVLWQKRFLEDVLRSEKRDSLIAVTHSPFIFDNSLQNQSADLRSFMRPSPV